jgi:hypothetical protein
MAENKKEIECEECCYVRDMTNIKPALCNFHQGSLSKEKEVLKIIDECTDHRGIINAEELKQRIKEK